MKSVVFGRTVDIDLNLPLAKVKWRPILTGVGLFGVFVALFAAIQFSTPNLVGNDGYFHIKFAQVMRRQGLLYPFEWLPLTILNAEAFYDHHFLFHVLLVPFTYGDLRLGAKWVSVIFPALAFLAGWVFLQGQRVPYAAWWALGFFAMSEAFLYRMSMPRVQAVSLLMLIMILHVTLSGRFHWLLPLSFVYIWLYDAFILVLIVVGASVIVRWLLDRHLNLRPLLYTLLGLALGLVINPYFPNNLIFIYHHILPKLIDTTAVRVGGEWYPYRTWSLVENSGLALIAFVAGTFALGLRDRRMETRAAILFAITVAFGLMLLKSRRFIEYYPAFALLFWAVAWAPLIEQWQQNSKWAARAVPLGLVLIFSVAIWFNVQTSRENLQDTDAYQRFANASAWLQANTPPKSRVFQTDWDDFTWLYYHNTHNTYTLGLDPTYMQSYDAELYDLWRNITRGWVERPGYAIAYTFEAGYVLTDLDHEDFLHIARTDPDLEEVYRDEYAAIFLVLSPPDKMGGEY